MRVGFVGLGNMGASMAANIRRAGFDLVVHDLRRTAAAAVVGLGASWADSPRVVAEQADVVITSLPGPPQVEAVLTGPNGVLAGLRAGAIWVDMSTNQPELIKRLGALAAERGTATLDAPVTGAADGAREGRLTIFVGGEAAVLERCRPVLAAMGTTIFHCGPLGTGLAAKLATNLLWFIHAVAIGEGLMLGAKAGIALPQLWEIIKASAGNSWVAEHDVPSIFRGDYDPSFTLDLCCKDLGLITDLARRSGVPLELGAQAEQAFIRARALYGGDKGELSVIRPLEEAVGLSLRADGY